MPRNEDRTETRTNNEPTFTVHTVVEIARRVGDRLYVTSNRSESVDCETMEHARETFRALENTMLHQTDELRERQRTRTAA